MASSFSSFPSPRQGRSVGRWGPLSPCFPFSLCVGGQTGAQNCFRTPGTSFSRPFICRPRKSASSASHNRSHLCICLLSLLPLTTLPRKALSFFSPHRALGGLKGANYGSFAQGLPRYFSCPFFPTKLGLYGANTPPHVFKNRQFHVGSFYYTVHKLFAKCLFNF